MNDVKTDHLVISVEALDALLEQSAVVRALRQELAQKASQNDVLSLRADVGHVMTVALSAIRG